MIFEPNSENGKTQANCQGHPNIFPKTGSISRETLGVWTFPFESFESGRHSPNKSGRGQCIRRNPISAHATHGSEPRRPAGHSAGARRAGRGPQVWPGKRTHSQSDQKRRSVKPGFPTHSLDKRIFGVRGMRVHQHFRRPRGTSPTKCGEAIFSQWSLHEDLLINSHAGPVCQNRDLDPQEGSGFPVWLPSKVPSKSKYPYSRSGQHLSPLIKRRLFEVGQA